MMKMALVDDDRVFLEREKELIEAVCNDYGIDVMIDIFMDGTEFLKSIEKYFVAFLDIDLPGLSGFDLAKYLREDEKNNTTIIFVSNKEQLVYDSFDYQPLRFIRKDDVESQIRQIIPKLIRQYKDTKRYILVKTKTRFERINIDQILYFETETYKLKVCTTNGDIIYRDRMNQKEKELSDYNFVRIHSGFLVNLKYVKSIEEGVLILENGKELPISRSKAPTVRKKVYNYLRQEV